MAKLDVYKLTGSGGGAGAVSPVAVHATRSNIKAFAGIQYSLKGIQSTLKSIERIEIEFIENDKLRDIAERRRKRREADRLAEERAEKGLGKFSGKASKGKLNNKDKKKVDSLFGKLFSGLEGLAMTAFKFLLKVAGLLAVKSTLEYFADPKNREKLVTFFRKASFVFNKIAGIVKFLVVDSLIEGISQTFGKDKTFGERVGGLWKIITGIVGLGFLLNPFGTMDAILSLLGLDFYRNKAANVAADVLDDVYIDGPDGQQRKYRKNPRTGRWEEIDPKTNRPVKPGTGTGTTKPGTTKLPTTKPGGNQIPKNQRLTPSQMASNLQKARLERDRLAALNKKLIAENKTLLGRGTGSNIFKGGLGNAPGRAMTFAFGKNKKVLTNVLGKANAQALKAGVKNFAGRIPWFGGFLVAAFSLLDGDPIDRALFKMAGSLVGGAVGSFIPIIGQIGIGTILGTLVGEYMGDLLYMLANPNKPDGGIEQIKRKIFEDSLNAWNGSKAAVKALWNWVGPKIMEAGNFIKNGITRFYQAIPLFEFPSVTIPGWIPGFGGKKVGGFEVVNPIFFTPVAAIQQLEAMKKAFFEQDKPITRVKMPTIPDTLKQIQGIFNWLGGLNQDGTSRAGQTGGRAAAKKKSDQRRAEDAAQRQAEREQNAALNAARDAFLEQNQIRQYDPKKTYREMELVYKNEGWGFVGMGYKDYHVFRNGKIIHVRYYGNLHEKNFKSKKAYEVFLAGGGNAMLRGKANYDVKKVLELGFAATAQIKKVQSVGSGSTPQPQGGTPPVVKGAVANDLKTRIRQLESGNNYATPFKAYLGGFGRAGEDLTKMTINQVVDWQKAYLRHQAAKGIPANKRSAAVGAYQMLFPELAADYVGVSRNALFSPANQDKMVEYYLDMAGQKDWKSGQISNAAYNNGLAGQFASIKRADGKGVYDNDGINKAYGTVLDILSGTARPPSTTTPLVQPKTSFAVDLDTSGINPATGRYTPVGQKATLEGKPVIWDGTTWQPDPEGGSEDSPTKSTTTPAQDGRGYAILPYQSSESDTALPFEQAQAIAEGLLGKKYSAYDLGTVGGLKEGGLADAVDRFKKGQQGDGFNVLDLLGLGDKGPGAGSGTGIDPSRYPSPGEDGYAGPKSGINPLDYGDQSGELTDNTGRRYSIEDVAKEIFGDPEQNKGPVNPNTYGGTHGFDLRDLFGNNRGLNPYGPDGQKVDMWTNSTGWQDKIPGWGDYSGPGLDFGSSFKTSGLDFSKAFGFSKGGKVPNNLKPFFLGGLFKGIKKAFSGVVKAVSSVVSGVGNFLSSPIGSLLTTAVGVIFPPLAPVIAGIKAVTALASGDIIGAITNTVGALTGFFPETMGNFFQGVTDTLGSGLGGVVNGFLKGGIGGALGGLGGMLPQGVQKFFGGIGKFIQKNPTVGAIIKSIPGVANIPGLSNLFGLEEFPGMPGPIGIARTLAGQFGMGGVFDALAGIAGMTQQTALMQQSPELGVDPRVFGIFNQNMSAFDPKGGMSAEYAMQTALEFVPIPLILLKLVPIDRPVPINNTQYIPQKAPAKQQPAKK